jgi:hypothetical protein
MTDEALLKSYRAVFVSEQGKVVLDDLMDFCRMFQVNDGMDVYEGRRSVFLHILESMGLTNTYNIATALLNVPPEIAEKRQEVADGTEETDKETR